MILLENDKKFGIYLTEKRLEKYKSISEYSLNIRCGAELHVLLSYFEIILRNAINIEMVKMDENWLLDFENSYIIPIFNNLKKVVSPKRLNGYGKFFEKHKQYLYEAKNKLKTSKKKYYK